MGFLASKCYFNAAAVHDCGGIRIKKIKKKWKEGACLGDHREALTNNNAVSSQKKTTYLVDITSSRCGI